MWHVSTWFMMCRFVLRLIGSAEVTLEFNSPDRVLATFSLVGSRRAEVCDKPVLLDFDGQFWNAAGEA